MRLQLYAVRCGDKFFGFFLSEGVKQLAHAIDEVCDPYACEYGKVNNVDCMCIYEEPDKEYSNTKEWHDCAPLRRKHRREDMLNTVRAWFSFKEHEVRWGVEDAD